MSRHYLTVHYSIATEFKHEYVNKGFRKVSLDLISEPRIYFSDGKIIHEDEDKSEYKTFHTMSFDSFKKKAPLEILNELEEQLEIYKNYVIVGVVISYY